MIFRLLTIVSLVLLPCQVWSLEIGALHWQVASNQEPYAEIDLIDKTKIDPAVIKGKIGSPEAYLAAGLSYDPGFAATEIAARSDADGRVVLRLAHLPKNAQTLDLLIVVNNRIALKLAEYRVDPRLGAQVVPPSPAGSLQFKVTAVAKKPTPNDLPASQKKLDDPVLVARAAVVDWAQAWSRRDVDAYVAAYVPDYAGQEKSGSRQAWIDQRRERIQVRSHISVELTDLKLLPTGDRIQATFVQTYRSDGPADRVRKRLILAPVNGRWLILSESILH